MDEDKKLNELPEEPQMPEGNPLGGNSEAVALAQSEDNALDKNVRLLSPARMVARRFFRSKLSVIGLVMIIALLVFCWLGPVFYQRWNPTEIDDDAVPPEVRGEGSFIEYVVDGETYRMEQLTQTKPSSYDFAPLSPNHFLGTDQAGRDVFTRLMYGGRISLTISFLTVFVVTILGIIFGGLAGFFGKWVDEIIMRICDMLMCIPSIPIMLIVGVILDGWEDAEWLDPQYRIYMMMLFLAVISWPGIARLVRGQILYLREQEYMVAAEAMGFSTARKIFKHLIPNVMPQLIVSMTLSLGSMILTESTLSYLGLAKNSAAWGTMINEALQNFEQIDHVNVWFPPGLCIVIAVLGFNFIGDGLRDALDPKARR